MVVLRVVKALTLITSIIQPFSPIEGHCVFINGMFTEASNGGEQEPLALYKTRQVQRSCAECGVMCMEERASPWECQAFSCLPLDMTCDLYTNGSLMTPPDNTYLFQATDVFHPMSINGHSYSIYLSSVTKTYQDAKTHCENMDSHLFHFDSLEDYEAIRMITSGEDFHRSYVGAENHAGTWVSSRDGTKIDSSVLIWSLGEPGNSADAENCVIIDHDNYQLRDVVCQRTQQFLCKGDNVG